VAACCERTVASSVAGVLLLALLVSPVFGIAGGLLLALLVNCLALMANCFGVDSELPWHCRGSALDERTAFGL